MDRIIAKLIVLRILLFNFVESTGFRRVSNAAVPKYNMRGHVFMYLCDSLFNKVAKKFEIFLKNLNKYPLQITYGHMIFNLEFQYLV